MARNGPTVRTLTLPDTENSIRWVDQCLSACMCPSVCLPVCLLSVFMSEQVTGSVVDKLSNTFIMFLSSSLPSTFLPS